MVGVRVDGSVGGAAVFSQLLEGELSPPVVDGGWLVEDTCLVCRVGGAADACVPVWVTGAARQRSRPTHSPFTPTTPSTPFRDALRTCASLDALIATLRRPLRLNEALDVELWMLGGCFADGWWVGGCTAAECR